MTLHPLNSNSSTNYSYQATMPKISQVYLDRFKNMLLREEILWNDPKTKSTETTVIITISFLPICTGFFTISTKSDRFDPKICHATLVLLSWCDISVILQSYFDHILTGGRKCCLNVIPAGSFSLSLPLSFFFSFPHANEPVCRLLPIIFTDYSVEIY